MSLRLRVQNPADTVTITVYLSQPAPDGYQWVKYGPVKGWYVFPGAVFSSGRRSLDITLTDGGAGDGDGLANGLLIDPAGAGTTDDDSGSAVKPQSGSSGINGGSAMCFITAAAGRAGGKLPVAMMAAALLLCFAGIRAHKR